MRGGTVSSCLAQPQSLMHNWAWWIIGVQWLLFGQWMLRRSLLYTIDVEESRYLPPATRHEEYGHITCHQPKAPGSASQWRKTMEDPFWSGGSGSNIQFPGIAVIRVPFGRKRGEARLAPRKIVMNWHESSLAIHSSLVPTHASHLLFHSSQGCYELPRILTINYLCIAIS